MKTPGASRRGDFLASVIERANERAPVVRPRSMALFEPVAPSLQIDTSADDATDGVRNEDPHSFERPSSAPLAHADIETSRQVPRASAASEEGGEVPIGRRHRDATPVPSHEQILEPSLRAAAREPVANERVVAQTPLLAQKLPTPPISALQPADTRQELRDSDARAPVHNVIDAAHARQPTPPPIAGLMPNPQIASQSAVAPTDDRANRQFPLQHAAAMSSVTISIGRVEVRAAPAAAASTARAKNVRAAMRLDEYLERKERKR